MNTPSHLVILTSGGFCACPRVGGWGLTKGGALTHAGEPSINIHRRAPAPHPRPCATTQIHQTSHRFIRATFHSVSAGFSGFENIVVNYVVIWEQPHSQEKKSSSNSKIHLNANFATKEGIEGRNEFTTGKTATEKLLPSPELGKVGRVGWLTHPSQIGSRTHKNHHSLKCRFYVFIQPALTGCAWCWIWREFIGRSGGLVSGYIGFHCAFLVYRQEFLSGVLPGTLACWSLPLVRWQCPLSWFGSWLRSLGRLVTSGKSSFLLQSESASLKSQKKVKS